MQQIAKQLQDIANKTLLYIDNDLSAIDVTKAPIDELDLFLMFIESLKNSYFLAVVEGFKTNENLTKKQFCLCVDRIPEMFKEKQSEIMALATSKLEEEAKNIKEQYHE